jgi:glucose-6-phosphate isomerase
MTTIDLTAVSGLPLSLDTETGLLADPTGALWLQEPGRRRFDDLRAVVAEPEAVDQIADRVAYLTYRDVRTATETGLAERGLRYDVTVTLPGSVNGEYVKTAGHYHGLDPHGVSWPEIYDVLFGSAVFVLQRAVGDPTGDPAVDRVVAVVAGPGDRLVIPPDYGHVTVNVGPTPLAVADLVATASENHYQGYAKRRGAAARVMATGDGSFQMARNVAYPVVPSGIEIILASTLEPFARDTPLYRLGMETPAHVAFLTHPDRSRFRI